MKSRRDKVLRVVSIHRLVSFLSENRHNPGWSVDDIANKSGVTRSVVYDIYGGKDDMTLKTLRALADLAGGEVVILLRKGKSKLPKVKT